MAFLTVAAIDVRVVDGTAVERTPLYQGGRSRTRDLTLISTEDETTKKRIFDCSIDLHSAAEETALRAACPRGVAVEVSGDFPDATLSCVADIGDAALFEWEDGGTLIYKTVALHLEQAS